MTEPRDDDARRGDSTPLDETLPLDATLADPSLAHSPFRAAADEAPIIPNYRVLRKLGEGGMGEVWEAEQLEPVRRTVAIKLIRAGLDSRQFVARFEAERQALAMMDHPGIARIFDAGTTERGVPYFVMEFVQGVPLAEYCDENGLDTEARLRLFMRVCDGVNHAHQKGIIHRDLKPGNILVSEQDGTPVPKVIDFGVAKATKEKYSDQTMLTRVGALIGTLEYMSPEQLEGSEDIDTRTDVYALGVILYELLAGKLPFDPTEHGNTTHLEMWRILRDTDPGKPSTRLDQQKEAATDTAAKRHTDVRSLKRRLSGDLDWITMKSLDKDRARRYDSPGALAADIQRHLDSEPVTAGPPSSLYRLSKFARRHKVGVTAAGFVAVALVVGMAGTTYGLLRARQAEREVRKEAAKTEAVNDFLHGMLASANPSQAQGREVTVREVLSAASKEVGGGTLPEELEVEAAVRSTIGATYQALGIYDEARPHLESALEIRSSLNEGDSEEVAESLHALGRLRWETNDYPEAERLIRSALEMGRRLHGNEHELVVSCLGDLAVVYQTQGDYVRADATLRESLELSRRLYGNVSQKVADNLNNLAWIVHFQGRPQEAEELFREALAVNGELLGPNHPTMLVNQLNLAAILDYLGKRDEAEAMYLETTELLEKVLGPDHPTTLRSLQSLGELYLKSDRAAQAQPILEEARETAERTLGPDHSLTTTLLADLGWVHRAKNELPEAEDFGRETLTRRMRSLGEENPYTIRSQWQLARVLHDRGKFAEAERVAREALDVGRRVLPEGNENLSSSLLFLGLAVVAQDRAAEAEPLLRECLAGREESLPEGNWELAEARSALGSALSGQGRFADAEPLLIRGFEEMEAGGAPPLRLRNGAARLVELYERWNAADPEAGKAGSAAKWKARLGG